MRTYRTIVCAILDGWGVGSDHIGNAILQAKTPTIDMIERSYPFTTLQASGIAVGLPWGEDGNSEVGHLTIGTGRIIFQHLPRIELAIHDGSFFQNSALLGACQQVRRSRSRLHFIGLVSSGSVHSYIDHLYGLLELAKRERIESLFIHVFSDGRDAPPKEGKHLLANLESRMQSLGVGKIASIIGRYYALDRDGHWERTQSAYECLVNGAGERAEGVMDAFEQNYARGITDEFIPPTLLNPALDTRIREHDAVVYFDYREDSTRQLTHAFVSPQFTGFSRVPLQSLYFVTMTEYEKNLPVQVAFPPITITYSFGEILAERGLRQARFAESEKYAHVTYFFNGGREQPFPGEDRVLAPSFPAPHYDKNPEMKSADLADQVVKAIESGTYAFILVNFANADMVGHTGNLSATIHAVEAIDAAIKPIMEAVLARDAVLFITGDHGNAEEKLDPHTGEPRTEHTTNPVPFYLIGRDFAEAKESDVIILRKKEVRGLLTDIAPTALDLLGIEKPVVMTGNSLLSTLGVTRR